MSEIQIVDSSFSSIVNAPIESIDLPTWVFTLPDKEYQGCSPAHVAAGFTTAPDGKRMSINVEVIGGTLMVQHYVEKLTEKHHVILESVSDIFPPGGRSSINVTWELTVKPLDGGRCEFINRVHTSFTDELKEFLEHQGIPLDVFATLRQPMSIAHNKQETPFFAASVERAALRH